MLEYLNRPVVSAVVVAVGQNREVLHELVTNLAKVIGGASFLIALTALICDRDWSIFDRTVRAQFASDLSVVEEELERS